MGKENQGTNKATTKAPAQTTEAQDQAIAKAKAEAEAKAKAEAEAKAKAEAEAKAKKKASAKKGYKLRKEYEGTLWKGNVLRSDLLTSKLVTDLKKNHPKGTAIFQK